MQSPIFTYIDPSPPKPRDGLLLGTHVAIQSNMCVRGWPAEANTAALENYIALETATAAESLRQAGAVLKGTTRMSEMGFGLSGDASADAISAGHADIALMTDYMGEARIAAASAGLVGFKPSYGRVSRFGLIGLIPSMECCGILAKTPEEIYPVMQALAGKDDRDLSMPASDDAGFTDPPPLPESRPVAGVIMECRKMLSDEEAGMFDQGLEVMTQNGIQIREVSLKEYDLLGTTHNVIGATEASSSCGKFDSVRFGHRTASAKNWNEMYLKSRAESFGQLLKTYLFQGAYFQFKQYAAFENACRIRGRLITEAEQLFKSIDMLVCPTRRHPCNACTAATVRDIYDGFSFTLMANVTGQPAIHLPIPLSEHNPYGLQLIGANSTDAQLLSVAARLLSSSEGGN